jgi:YVTN family beta-propeller protein
VLAREPVEGRTLPKFKNVVLTIVAAVAGGLCRPRPTFSRRPAGRLYVSSISADQVTAIDMATDQIVRTYPVSGGPQRIAVHGAGDELYIASQAVGLEVLDLTTGTHTAVAGVGAGGVGLALSPDEQQLYVTRPPSGELIIVDRASRQVVKTLDGLSSPRNVAFTADGRVALVTGEGNVVYFIR